MQLADGIRMIVTIFRIYLETFLLQHHTKQSEKQVGLVQSTADLSRRRQHKYFRLDECQTFAPPGDSLPGDSSPENHIP